MQPNTSNVFKAIILILFFTTPIGWIVACIYISISEGIDVKDLSYIDLLSFWYHTPFILGYVSEEFKIGIVLIVTFSGSLTMIVMAYLFKKKPTGHGTARWADERELITTGYVKPYKDILSPIFGKMGKPEAKKARYLTNGPQPHTLVAAPTRAGKGVGVVIPTLLTHNGSSIVLDVKGELFEMTSRARVARGDRVFKFSPIDDQGRTHRYNPVDDIAALPPERRFIEARRLAANLIVTKGESAEGFLDGARDLFVAGVLVCIEKGAPNIGAVYDLFSQPGEKYQLFAKLAAETKIPEAQRIFDNMAANDNKILTSYTSVLGDGGLNLWADQLVKNATAASDFSLYDLRRDPTCVFIVVSPNDLEVLAPLVRLLFQQIVSILQRTLPEKDEVFEVLFLLDEFKHLGKMSAIETAITTIAGYNGRFMFIIQTLSALTENYKQTGKDNFLGNTGLQVFMATADADTPDYISKSIGDYTRVARSKSWQNYEFIKTNVQERDESSRLIRPEQIRLLDEDKQIVLIKGQPPVLCHKIKYYKDRILEKLYEDQHGPLPEPEKREAAEYVTFATNDEENASTQAPASAPTPAHVPAQPQPQQQPEYHAEPVPVTPDPPGLAQQAELLARINAVQNSLQGGAF